MLATSVALAVRVEPALLRHARLTLTPGVSVAAETALWFSPLVESSSMRGLVLDGYVGETLRERLAQDRVQLDASRALITKLHAGTAPTLRLEEDLRYAALVGDQDEVRRLLAVVLRTVTAEPDRAAGIARWADRAIPSLPQAVRDEPLAQRLLAISAATFESPVLVGVQLTRRGVQVSAPPSAGAPTLTLPPSALKLRFEREMDPDQFVDLKVVPGNIVRRRIRRDAELGEALRVTTEGGRTALLRPQHTSKETMVGSTWKETMVGGSPQAERAEFEQLARDIMKMQLENAKIASAHGAPHGVDRALHAKTTLATDRAELRFRDDLPADLSHGFAQSGRVYPSIVRFSNAAGIGQSDVAQDLRGVALRVQVSPKESYDLLMTNYPVSFARDARQFVTFNVAMTGNLAAKLRGVLRLIRLFGVVETNRMLTNVTRSRRTVSSVATETYWSRGAMRWGPTLAVRYLLRPAPGTAPAPPPPEDDPDYLSTEAARRLAQGDIRFELCVQRYVDEHSTPIEDTAVAWSERARRRSGWPC
jgi:hypothetical protein